MRRTQRRSFTPASFMEEDVVDFPDELDTSFFARVKRKNNVIFKQKQNISSVHLYSQFPFHYVVSRIF